MNSLSRLLPAAVLLLFWEAGARFGLFNAFLMPAPSKVLLTIWEMLVSLELLADVAQSFGRVLTGFILAAAIGTPLGLWLALSERASRFVEPIVHFLRPIPPIAWIPLAILWFGIGNGPSYFLTFVASLFPIVLNVGAGVRNISRVHFDVARSFEAPRGLVLRKVIWPAVLPYAISGYRIALGVAWMTVVGAEMIAARSGLGYLIHSSQDLLRTDKVMAGMVAIGLTGLAIDVLLRACERRLVPWKDARA